MPTNVNPAVSPSIQQTGRTSETKSDRLSVTRDGGSSSAFAKHTDVKFTNSVDNMSAVLEKVSTAKMGADNALPSQLQKMINNVVKSAFALENSLGEGLGSAISSERYSIEQLTTLSKMFNQLANNTQVGAVTEQVANAMQVGELTDELQNLLTGIRNLVIENAIGGSSTDLAPVNLEKLAFQLLNDGTTENVSDDVLKLLELMSAKTDVKGMTTQQGNEEASIFKQVINSLFPKNLTNVTVSKNALQNMNMAAQRAYANATQNTMQPGAQTAAAAEGAPTPTYSANNTANAQAGQPAPNGQSMGNTAQNSAAMQENTTTTANTNVTSSSNATAANNAGNNTTATSNAPAAQQNAQASQTASGQTAEQNANTANAANQANSTQTNAANTTAEAKQAQTVVDSNGNVLTRDQSVQNAMKQAAELENNPLFRQIFSRYGFTQETGITRQQQNQPAFDVPVLNNKQATAALKDMAQLLLKDSELTEQDVLLLKNFVNGNTEQLSQQDAKQLNLLLRMVQMHIPSAVQLAGQQEGLDGLPKLWAFLQLAELSTIKDTKVKDLKKANREIKTMIASMKSSVSSEGGYKADGQKAISFVMPLYIGENEQSYPAYVHLYDEPEHEDETGRKRKDTWLRVCVLTENIGAVDIVCQLYEGNNLNLRVRFSDQEAVQAFSEYLPDIRKALYDSTINLNDLKVGTVN